MFRGFMRAEGGLIEGGRILKCAVRREQAGRTLEAFLAGRFPYHTSPEWARLVTEGAVLVNELGATPDRVLDGGDTVRYLPPEKPEPGVDTAVVPLYEDRDILLVDKPGNLPAHPAGKYFRNTLWAVLKDRFGVETPNIINRLDRETSGVTLVARNPRAAAVCRAQFDDRSIKKKYTVFVEGVMAGPVRARGYLGPCAGSAVRMKQRFEPVAAEQPAPGRETEWADTEFTPLERYGGFTVAEAVPHTGRLHQIRATLLSLGCPVVGDKIYGPDERIFLRFLEGGGGAEDAARLRMGRQALHASELVFRHPADGRRMAVSAPLPADMRALLDNV